MSRSDQLLSSFASSMNCALLQTFVRVVETGNISAAARSLFLAQSAVSAQLATLTRAVGVTLLERVHGRWEPTAAGRAVYDRALELLRLVDTMEREVHDRIDDVAGHVVVGSTRTITDTILPRIVASFRGQYPKIRLEVLAGNRRDAEMWLASDRIDAALVALPFGKKGLAVYPFGNDRLLAIVPVTHRLAERDDITFEELASDPFVLFEDGSGTRSLIEERLGTRFPELDVALSLNSNDAIVGAVEAGLGVSFMPEVSARRWERIGSIRALPIRDLELFRELAVAVREGVARSSATEKFIAHLSETALVT
ncbi:MAG: LysR substrate-binding domain-containing protein [Vulcanimicrobiaceae bacterium]